MQKACLTLVAYLHVSAAFITEESGMEQNMETKMNCHSSLWNPWGKGQIQHTGTQIKGKQHNFII